MTNEELNTALYEKLFAEQQDFKEFFIQCRIQFHDLTDEIGRAHV